MKRLPLTYRAEDDIILMHAGEAVTRSHFVGLCQKLARQLPEEPSVINLCEDRLAFSVTFFATLMAGGTNLLPANRVPATIDQLLSRQPQAIIISDGDNRGMYVSAVTIDTVLGLAVNSPDLPRIPANQLAAVVYTSGSTGPSSEIKKTWRTLHDSSRINMTEYGPDRLTHCLATVPSQHMWGLETTVLAPLFAPLVLASEQPLLVADIVAGLQRLPSPGALISTPVHLRALIEAGVPLPRLDRIYSATAPLTTTMAQRLEQLTGAVVIDVYGCSEAGCLAKRATAHEDHWQLFKAFKLERVGTAHLVSAPHLPAPVALMDFLNTTDRHRFELVGRQDDLINIAGKRASMANLTQILLDIPGVIDGVIFQPPANDGGKTTRLAALVVAPELTASELRKRLGNRIDPAFMPRPLRLVDSLPRSGSGKLPERDLLSMYTRVCDGA
ncbi:MAG: AMP-binding protein [Wenzhouxiangellaceae bacterium]|nr:AMP-binding protein [Wenzhouxiangellaceae bacterium]